VKDLGRRTARFSAGLLQEVITEVVAPAIAANEDDEKSG
jgi:hypothetical protein